jgi:hypothetical protein
MAAKGVSARSATGFAHKAPRVSPRADFALSGSGTGVLRVCVVGRRDRNGPASE